MKKVETTQSVSKHFKYVAGFYVVWLKINHHFVIEINVFDIGVWTFYSKYLSHKQY